MKNLLIIISLLFMSFTVMAQCEKRPLEHVSLENPSHNKKDTLYAGVVYLKYNDQIETIITYFKSIKELNLWYEKYHCSFNTRRIIFYINIKP
jgi:hypothetical protein